MAFGIKLIQNGVVLADGSAVHPAPISVEAGILCFVSFTGTTGRYTWTLSAPAGSGSVISSRTSAAPSFVPDIDGGSYSVTLLDESSNAYVLDIATPTAGTSPSPGQLPTFATVSSLRVNGGASGGSSSYSVQSYAVLGDGGGGIFDDVTSVSSHADDGVMFFLATAKLFKRRCDGHAISARWAGCACNGSTNDDAGWARLVAALGDTTQLRQALITIPGISCISATILFKNKNVHLMGTGYGSTLAGLEFGGGSALKWVGTGSHIPMVRIQASWGTQISRLRFIGATPAADRPSCAISVYHTLGPPADSPANTNLKFDDLWIGSFGGYDTLNGTQFQYGILIEGDDGQDDQSSIHHCHIEGVENSCIKWSNGQNVLWLVTDCVFNAFTDGVHINAARDVLIQNCSFTTGSNACVKLTNDGEARWDQNFSEAVSYLYDSSGGGTFRGYRGYFRCEESACIAHTGVIAKHDAGSASGNIVLELSAIRFTRSNPGSWAGGTEKILISQGALIAEVGTLFWADGQDSDQHFTFTCPSGSTVSISWGKNWYNSFDNASTRRMAKRVDFDQNPELSPGIYLGSRTASNQPLKQLVQLDGSGNVVIGDTSTPVTIGNDLSASVSNADVRGWRNYSGILGDISFKNTNASPQIIVEPQTGNAGCPGLNLHGGQPFAMATGNNRIPGVLTLEVGTPTNGGTTNATHDFKIAGATYMQHTDQGFKWPSWLRQATVGAAGAASALPLTPTRYLQVVDSDGTKLVVPAYLQA